MQLSLLEWQQPTAPVNNTAPWPDADAALLMQLYTDGETDIDTIAARLGRTREAVYCKANRMGLGVLRRGAGAKVRRCMPCQKNFWSTWIGNRICADCTRSLDLECA